ncbi:ATP-dependent DNA ligase [Patellaria atrata CBS 101060]|uniref:DNA ligase n=1 Tax=Patellaria atrata CBS 101060 TaxID=1346257 RepID=A0A9P4SGT6_9PEZI|nr:ATP-dependent DNA ligase [Patellaria atrata CBS 101060]
MAPKQATLGKFFGNPNGTKAPPQQSTLSFSTKSNTKKAAEEDDESKENSVHGVDKSSSHVVEVQDQEMVDDGTKSGSEEDVTESSINRSKKTSSAVAQLSPSSRKRSTAGDVESSHSSEDEPPTKRMRRKLVEAKKTKKVEETSPSAKPKTSKVPTTNGKKKSPNKEKSTGINVEAKKVKKAQKEIKGEEDAEELQISPTSAKEIKSEVALSPESDKSEVQEEEEVSSEDEKPEVAAAAREKVQSTLLKSGTKDPYPDWKVGEPVPYAALCTTFSKIEMTTKRLEILAHCSLFLRQVLRLTPNDLLPTIQLMINKLAADYTGIELGIGESLIMKAIGESTGRSLQVIKADQNEIGDLGLVAAKSRSTQRTMFKPKALTVRGVHEGLMAIATIEGQGSQGRKVAGIMKLLSSADAHLAGKGNKGIDITEDKGGPSEAKYIVRTLEGKLRLGLAEKTVLVAVAQAIVFHEASQKGKKPPSTDDLAKGESTLKFVYSELPSYEVIIPAVLEHGIDNLREKCKLQPGVPLKPMLAKPTKSITEVLDRFEGKDFTCEYKYDGERAQIHFVAHDSPDQYATEVSSAGKSEKGVSNIFSRNSEDLSKKYPDILAKLPTWLKDGTKSFVLDCETVAWDTEQKKVLPFQQLMTRKRKDVKAEDIKVKVCVFAFDLLYLNGEALVTKTLRERRELLRNSFIPVEGEFTFASYGDTNELDQIQILLDESVKASCEGLMVKMLDGTESHYEPSRRSQNWLKVKKDYLQGVGDSLDLVVLGAYFGKGKRTSVYGAFLLACYNPSSQTYETVCNIGTGFSEAVLEELHTQLSENVIERPKPFYAHSTGNKDQPDVWFEAKFVWEVKTADLTLSPRYRAAAEHVGGGGKGISLRFPRFIKLREDKKPDQATTGRQIAEMYQKQESVGKNKGPSVDDDFEY